MSACSHFALLFQGRAGSSWVIDALGSRGDARVQGEALIALRSAGAKAQIAWIHRFFAGTDPARHSVAGFKAKLTDVLDPGLFAEALQANDCRIVHLIRRNPVKQTISWIRSDELHSARGAHNVRSESDRLRPGEIAAEELVRRLACLERGRGQLERFVAALDRPTLKLAYEDLLADSADGFDRLQRFLGLEPRALSTTLVKHTDDDLARAVTNLPAIRAALADTPLGALVDEGEARSAVPAAVPGRAD